MLDPKKLLGWQFPPSLQTYTARDTMLYALGLGCGNDPFDQRDLHYVYEDGLRSLSTMAVVLGTPGFWLKDPAAGVDWRMLVHGEQGVVLHRPLPVQGAVIGHTRVTGLLDKGREKGAVLFTERQLIDQATGESLATLTSTSMLRGDGGFGGPRGPAPAPHCLPGRPCDMTVELRTIAQSALIYRLSGDYNPLHADPRVAAMAGFRLPILHGLCSFGIAGRAILRAFGDAEDAWLRRIQARFSAPVFPGETLRTEIWKEGATASFRVRVVERDVTVLDNGFAIVQF